MLGGKLGPGQRSCRSGPMLNRACFMLQIEILPGCSGCWTQGDWSSKAASILYQIFWRGYSIIPLKSILEGKIFIPVCVVVTSHACNPLLQRFLGAFPMSGGARQWHWKATRSAWINCTGDCSVFICKARSVPGRSPSGWWASWPSKKHYPP